MSEEGWNRFLDATETRDWVVLHGGATAVFRVSSLRGAATLATAIAERIDAPVAGVLLTLGDAHVTVRLTRDVWNLEETHLRLASMISETARAFGAVAEREAVQEVQIAIASKADDTDVDFWRAVLGYDAAAPDNAIDPLGHGSTTWFQQLDAAKPLRHAMHIDVSVAREQARGRVDAALAAGGRMVDESKAPAHWTLSDRAGNRVCICAWPDGADRK